VDYGSLQLTSEPKIGKLKTIKDQLDSYEFKNPLQGTPTKLMIVDDSTFVVASTQKNEAQLVRC